MNSSDDRRKHPRVTKHFLITYYDEKVTDSQRNVSQLKNISQGGVCFSSCAAYPKDTRLKILIKTPYLAETLSAVGIVVDCIEKVPNVIYEIHIRLESLNEKTQIILEKIEKSFTDSKLN